MWELLMEGICKHGVPRWTQRCWQCQPETLQERREREASDARYTEARVRLMEARRKAGK